MGAVPRGKAIPVYTSLGDCASFLVFPFLFSMLGEWIGWVTPDRQVFDVDGVYVGWLTEEPRILRRKTYDMPMPRKTPPVPPSKFRAPSTVPLPPMMAELPFEYLDVLLDEPERLHTTDSGELKKDLD
jgi:hypothetical protein